MNIGIIGGIGILIVLVIIMVVVFSVQGKKKREQQSQQTFQLQPTQMMSQPTVCSGCGKGVNTQMTFCPGCGTQTNMVTQPMPQQQFAPNMQCQKCGNTDLHFGQTEVKQKRNAGGRFVNLILFVASSIWAVITLAIWVFAGAASLGVGFFFMAAFYARRRKSRLKTQAMCKRCGHAWIVN